MTRTMKNLNPISDLSPKEIREYSAGAANLAGGRTADPYLSELLDAHAAGELTTEQAQQLAREHILG